LPVNIIAAANKREKNYEPGIRYLTDRLLRRTLVRSEIGGSFYLSVVVITVIVMITGNSFHRKVFILSSGCSVEDLEQRR